MRPELRRRRHGRGPAIILTPSQGPEGVSVQVIGVSFSGSTAVSSFTFNGVTPSTQDCTSQTTDTFTGDFVCSFTVPDDAPGAYTVSATVSIQSATATFTITTPAIALIPNSDEAGLSITVDGSGFTPSTNIPTTVAVGTFTFDGVTPTTQTCTSQTMGLDDGAFTCTFTVPNDGPGPYTVTASGSDIGTVPADTASNTFTITQPTTTVTTTSTETALTTEFSTVTVVNTATSAQTETQAVTSTVVTGACDPATPVGHLPAAAGPADTSITITETSTATSTVIVLVTVTVTDTATATATVTNTITEVTCTSTSASGTSTSSTTGSSSSSVGAAGESVPQFPLTASSSLLLFVALLLPAIMLMRKRRGSGSQPGTRLS